MRGVGRWQTMLSLEKYINTLNIYLIYFYGNDGLSLLKKHGLIGLTWLDTRSLNSLIVNGVIT